MLLSHSWHYGCLPSGYSHYQNSRQLSEDEPAYMARGHLMFPGILGDHHRAMFNPGEAGLGQHHPLAWRGLGGGGGGIVGGGVGGESCDCSRCELDDSFSEVRERDMQIFCGVLW